MTALLCVLIGVGALGLGLLVGFRMGGRRPAVAPAPAEPAPEASVGELLQLVFRSGDAGLAVLSRAGVVVLHNDRAAELGVVHDEAADPRAAAAAQQVLRSGLPMAVDLSPLDRRGRQPTAVLAQVRPLGNDFAMVEASDTSEAVRLEATRRDFVANVSHELKTPVGAVRLLAEAVLDAADDPTEVRRFGTRIVKEINRLGNLVTELIALSRLTGAERLPELSVVDVDEVVQKALARSAPSAEAADIEITVDRATGLEVDGDLTLLVTALCNLVENAIAYSPAQASVSVSRRSVGPWVEIAVTDRGIGIAREHQARVFERFFRVDQARSRATGGTGLGLAIVKHVAQNHGGEVRLWSSPGTGSTFTMRLPLRTETDTAGEADTVDEPGAAERAESVALPGRAG